MNNEYDYRLTELPIQKWYSIVEGFSSRFVKERIEKYDLKPKQCVLDPFCGTGTTAITCKYEGIDSVSIDANPWMCIVTKAKTDWDVDLNELAAVRAAITGKIPREHVERERIVGFYAKKDYSQKCLHSFFEESFSDLPHLDVSIKPPSIPRLDRKMSKLVLNKVLFLKQVIKEELRKASCSDSVKNLIWFAFGAHLMDVSNMTWYGPKVSYRKYSFIDAPVFVLFENTLENIEKDLLEAKGRRVIPTSEVILGDSRHVDRYIEGTIDCVLTSPPYMNEACYTDQSQFQLYFLDLVSDFDDLRDIKKNLLTCNTKYVFKDSNDSIEVENFSPVMEVHEELVRRENREQKNWGWNRPKMLIEYFGGMKKNLESVFKVLKEGGHYDLVLGDSAIAGVHIPTDVLIAKLAEEIGYSETNIQVFRERKCSRHNIRLRESIVGLLK